MDIREIATGLWIWTAPHPDWKPENDKPGGWGEMVACVYYEPRAGTAPSPAGRVAAEDAIVLIDPLVPPPGSADAERFWTALDRDVARAGLPVAVLLGNEYHARSAKEILDRYASRPGASIWGSEAAAEKYRVRPTHTFRDNGVLPAGVRSFPVSGLSRGEVAYFIKEQRTLVIADAVIGAGGGRLRVAPASWAADGSVYQEAFRSSLRGLLDLGFDTVLVSHGAPVLSPGGREALAEALESPAWGE